MQWIMQCNDLWNEINYLMMSCSELHSEMDYAIQWIMQYNELCNAMNQNSMNCAIQWIMNCNELSNVMNYAMEWNMQSANYGGWTSSQLVSTNGKSVIKIQ